MRLSCLLLLVTLGFSFEGCEPFGPRIFYGDSIKILDNSTHN